MQNYEGNMGFSRRQLLRLSAAGATAWGAKRAFPELIASASPEHRSLAKHPSTMTAQYNELLQTWCDGLLSHQLTTQQDRNVHGGLLCPACGLVHGRCGDAVYPLLRVAHATGEAKYVRAAELVHEWSERVVSRSDGSWVNDVTLSTWQGITVFHAIALAEALHHHGGLLSTATRHRWTDRLARAAKFLDGFITIETGNINYPVTATLCFALCAQVLEEPRYQERARQLAHTSLEYFTANGLLFGEGHPLNALTEKHCRPVDLGYNVEESLPALAVYALLSNDRPVLDRVVAALQTHMEFMLPDGGWDNSWGSRNYKWSWWGSRTSDGCQPAYVLLAGHDPRFREVARRNFELMAQCTHNGLLYGGPHYFAHGDPACIHHTFTHAKALATVLDRGPALLESAERPALPRDGAYGLKSFPEIGTHLAAVGSWRATVTDYDWEYVEHVQAGAGGTTGGGHATGGALSLLFHRDLGPVLVASMTEYQMIEMANQQQFGDYPHMTLTTRIECAPPDTAASTSLNDLQAKLSVVRAAGQVSFDATGQLLNTAHQPSTVGEMRYHLSYRLTEAGMEITANVETTATPPAPLRLILPVVSPAGEAVDRADERSVHIAKPKGTLHIRTDAAQGFEAIPHERTFNLVPGFECVALAVILRPGQEIHIHLDATPGNETKGAL